MSGALQSRWDRDATTSAVDHMRRAAATSGTGVPADIIRHYARVFDVSERTIWSWLEKGPPKPRRPKQLSSEIRSLVALHNGQLKGAHNEATAKNLYTKSYQQFCREFKNLPPAEQVGLRRGVPAMTAQGLYLKQQVEGRLDVVMYDHTECDIYLRRLYPRKVERFRPWLSLLIDSATRFILAWVVTEGDGMKGDPDTEAIRALLAQAIRGQQHEGIFIGGKPRIVQSDNALAHSANAMLEGFVDLQITSRSIAKGAPWQDGPVEALMKTMSNECLSQMVGYTAALEDRYSHHPWEDDSLLTMSEFLFVFNRWVDHYNFGRFHSTIGGTPFEAWRENPVPVERVEDVQLRHAFMGSSRKKHRVSKNGVRFDTVDYTHPKLRKLVGADVVIRHLPNDRSVIHVYDRGVFVCEAVPHAHLTEQDRIRLVADRKAEQQRVNHRIKTSRKRMVERRTNFAEGLPPDRDPNLPQHLHENTEDRDALLAAGNAALAKTAEKEET